MNRGFRYSFTVDATQVARWWSAFSSLNVRSPLLWKPALAGSAFGAMLGAHAGAIAYRDRYSDYNTAAGFVVERVVPMTIFGGVADVIWPVSIPLFGVAKAGVVYAHMIDQGSVKSRRKREYE